MSKNVRFHNDESFQVQAAWLYHVEGLTQTDIAEYLGVSRFQVLYALKSAKQNGIVRVQINSPYFPCLLIEEALQSRFGLSKVIVIPSGSEGRQIHEIIGDELGKYLSVMLKKPEIRLLGLAWGNTLSHAAGAIPTAVRRDLEIVSITGEPSGNSNVNGFEIISRISRQLSASHTFFTAPLYASSEQSGNTIIKQDVFQDILSKVRHADLIVTSAGDISATSSFSVPDLHKLPRDISINSLIAAGAVGDLMGHYINSSGQLIDHTINRRIIGLHPFELKNLPNVVLAAGGIQKIPIISAVLEMGILDVLITDQLSAEGVLEYTNYKCRALS